MFDALTGRVVVAIFLFMASFCPPSSASAHDVPSMVASQFLTAETFDQQGLAAFIATRPERDRIDFALWLGEQRSLAERASPLLIGLLSDESSSVRTFAAASLAKLGERSLSIIMNALSVELAKDDGDARTLPEGIADHLILALVWSTGDPLPRLRSLIAMEPTRIRNRYETITMIVLRFRGAAAQQAMSAMLHDPDARIRDISLQAMEYINILRAHGNRPVETRESLFGLAMNNPNLSGAEASRVLLALLFLEESRSSFLLLARTAASSATRKVAISLAHWNPEAADVLIDIAIHGPDQGVRQEALDTLRHHAILPRKAAPLFAERLAGPTKSIADLAALARASPDHPLVIASMPEVRRRITRQLRAKRREWADDALALDMAIAAQIDGRSTTLNKAARAALRRGLRKDWYLYDDLIGTIIRTTEVSHRRRVFAALWARVPIVDRRALIPWFGAAGYGPQEAAKLLSDDLVQLTNLFVHRGPPFRESEIIGQMVSTSRGLQDIGPLGVAALLQVGGRIPRPVLCVTIASSATEPRSPTEEPSDIEVPPELAAFLAAHCEEGADGRGNIEPLRSAIDPLLTAKLVRDGLGHLGRPTCKMLALDRSAIATIANSGMDWTSTARLAEGCPSIFSEPAMAAMAARQLSERAANNELAGRVFFDWSAVLDALTIGGLPGQLDPTVAKSIVAGLAKSTDPDVHFRGIEMIGELGDRDPALVTILKTALHSGSLYEREAANDALFRLGIDPGLEAGDELAMIEDRLCADAIEILGPIDKMLRPTEIFADENSGSSTSLPHLPWPPPPPSSMITFGREMDRATLGRPEETLAQIERRLVRRLLRADPGFDSRLFGIPNGFAMVAKLEQIDERGRPLPGTERWLDVRPPPRTMSDYLLRLFFAPPGYYRNFVFLFTDLSNFRFGTSPLADMRGGGTVLPPEIARQPFASKHAYVLVYSFERRDRGRARPFTRLGGLAHLEGAGLTSDLGVK